MSGQQKKNSRWAWLTKIGEGFGEVTHGAVSDIRHKLVEEAWFGRAVTPERRDLTGWETLCDRLAQERGHAPDHAREHEHDRDLDP
jgi:hypothetical protein